MIKLSGGYYVLLIVVLIEYFEIEGILSCLALGQGNLSLLCCLRSRFTFGWGGEDYRNSFPPLSSPYGKAVFVSDTNFKDTKKKKKRM